MGNLHLVTGYLGREHITAVDQAAFNAALIGTGQFVLDKGKVFEAQVISNNQIRVLDGELMMQGRFVRLNPDTYVDLTIENGTQGLKRNDLIVARYNKNTVTGVEGVDLVVIKGTAVDGVAVDPAHTEGDITNGVDAQHDFPLWRIPIDSLNVGEPVALFGEPFIDSMRTLPGIRRYVEAIHGEVDKQLAEQDKEIDEKIAGISSYLKPETLNDATKALFGLGSDAVPDDVFRLLNEKTNCAVGSYVGTNVYGKDNPNTLTFDFEPTLVFVAEKTDYDGEMMVLLNGWTSYCRVGGSGGGGSQVAAWSGNTVSWYSTDRSSYQFNSNHEFWYIAIG